MKEFFKHNDDLFSISPVEYSFRDKMNLGMFINKILDLSKPQIIFLYAKRPNGNVPSFIKRLKKRRTCNILSEGDKNGYFELSFLLHYDQDGFFKVEIIVDFWLLFEQPTILFSECERSVLDRKEILAYNSLPWDQIVASVSGYIIFRGVEEDVLWLGKSSQLSYSNLFDEMNLRERPPKEEKRNIFLKQFFRLFSSR